MRWISCNCIGVVLVVGIGSATFLLIQLMRAVGLESELASSIVMGTAGTVMLCVDYTFRRRMGPLSPMWRLISQDAGGHISVIPCWVMGAYGVFVGCDALLGALRTALPSLPSDLSLICWCGFCVPVVIDYFWPFGLHRGQSIDADTNTPFEPS